MILNGGIMSIWTRPFAGSSTVVLILRLTLGIIFFAHGAQKMFGLFGGGGLSGTADFFESIGIPAPLAYLTAFVEFFGGIAMILGLLTRIFSLGIAIVMLVAMIQVHVPAFFPPEGIAYPLTNFTIALSIFLLGPGEYSLDRAIFRKKVV
jgi:putative oxidoreductase